MGTGAWIVALVQQLAADDPVAHARLVAVVGVRRATIGLDGEQVEVGVVGGRLVVQPPGSGPVEGEGWTDRAVVLAVLDGRLEATTALREGRVHARGSIEALSAIFHAIEILLDAATRSPGLRELARAYRAAGPAPPLPVAAAADPGAHDALLDRLGVL